MKIHWLLVSFTVCVFLSACAALSLRTPTEESLRETAEKVWTFKTKRQFGPVYDHANEEYKSYVDREAFIRRSNLRYTAYSIESIEIVEPGKAFVSIQFVVSFQGADFAGKMTEEWLWEQGGWRINMMPYLNTPFGTLIKKPSTSTK